MPQVRSRFERGLALLGEDIEALHDMRVTTRRMRSAFRVFGNYYQPKAVASSTRGLKRTGRALGPVHDLDVFRARMQAYLTTLPEAEQDSPDGFLTVLEAQRKAVRARKENQASDRDLEGMEKGKKE